MMDVSLDQMKQRVATEMFSWKSIELRVRTDQVDLKGGDSALKILDSSAVLTSHYIETARRQRFLEEGSVFSKSGDRGRMTAYSDGTKTANVRSAAGDLDRQQLVIIEKDAFHQERVFGESSRPRPLTLFYVGKVPLHEALASAQRLPPVERLGRPCETFLFEKVPWGSASRPTVYRLDRETGVPLEVANFDDVDAATRDDKPGWIWQARSLDTIQGHHLPLESDERSFTRAADGSQYQPSFESKIHVVEARYDADYPASTFWPTIGPGVQVMDSIAKKSYTTPKPEPDGPKAAETKVVQPIRADEPVDSTPWVAGGGMVVGAVLIVVGLLAWWRRR